MQFTICDLIPPVEGRTHGDHWNGWACPRFTLEQGMQIVAAWNKEYGTFTGVNDTQDGPEERPCARFDAETRTFRFYDPTSDQIDDFGVTVLDGEDVWPIGSHGWMWEAEVA